MAENYAYTPDPAVPSAGPCEAPFPRTRFALPGRPTAFLRRPRLVEHLDRAPTIPLTLVTGPARAGKTLLTADRATMPREPVAWLAVEAGDRRAGTFWAYAVEALRTCGAWEAHSLGAPADSGGVGRGGLRLPPQAASALAERTRSWAAGLRLSALGARESPDPERCPKEFEADHSTVAGFLLAEVLRGRRAETQDSPLRVSVLDRFCPGLADSLTPRCDAGPILAELHRENVVIERLEHSSYRLHPLSREILQGRRSPRRRPRDRPALHRCARGGADSALRSSGARSRRATSCGRRAPWPERSRRGTWP
ncbi:hypothetical protein ACFW4M_01040 [Streptomyces sp. NPDC058794]|uniref:hypothetical protein n=1 Tax=Streptomyces sp. NPDC058794 TaxID=3346636 RepID=UPI00368F1AF1